MTKAVSSSTSGTVTADGQHVGARSIDTPAMLDEHASARRIRSGMPFWEPPSHRTPTFWRMNDTPTAVISGASFGALRSGR
ncbi:MAG: hypothetical protein WKF40_09265 [Thermoleophilaceae bacterium]